MIAAGAFLTAAAALLLLSPWLLTGGRWQVRHPRTALTAWFAVFGGGIAAALASVAAAILAAVSGGTAATAAEAVTVTLVAWVSLGGVGAVLAFISLSAEPLSQSWRASLARYAPAVSRREQHPGYTLVWFDAPELFACAVPGRHPEILVSTALQDALTIRQLQAVIAHEHAHLRLGHGWAVRIAELNALCLPRMLRAGRDMKRSTLLLVELIADDTAAGQVGAVHLANALAALAKTTNDPGLELRAERLTLRRWKPPTRRHLPQLAIRPTDAAVERIGGTY
ncbi:M56 family metallopeptidase [Microbacterium sp.]|uniref:M56 family metallopeptidase n=1 Tax=Microbacterium sp. TaxID=51671 RepID=UPI0026199987|nr:M56 family metallopeptidase [Microbacterium sp.]